MEVQQDSPENQYYLKYNLVRDPFPAGGFDGVVHLTPALKHRLKLIKTLIDESEKFIVVTSPLGAGRSILAEYLITIKDPNWEIGFVKASQGLGIDPLALKFLQNIFPDKSFAELKPAMELHNFLEYCSENNKTAVLIIDDAHKLPIHTLEFILQLAELRYEKSLFHFVLFADEMINDLLEGEKLSPLSSEILYKVSIPSLSRKQTEEYISNRIALSGDNTQFPFDEKEVNYIYRASGGLPGGINILAKQVMMENLLPGKKPPGLTRYILAAALVAVVSLGVYSWFYGNARESVLQMTARYFPPGTIVVETAEQPETDVVADAADHTPVENSAGSDDIPEEVTESEPESMPAEQAAADSRPGVDENDTAMEEAEADLPQTDATVAEAGMGPEPETDVSAMEKAETPVEEEAVQSTPAGEGTVQSVPAREEENETPPAEDQAGPETGVTEDNAVPEHDASAAYAGLRGAGWLIQQPRNYYVLQLISARDVKNLEELLVGLPEQTLMQLSTYTNYTPSGKPRYLLLYGLYPEKKIADVAVEELPEQLREVGPWPRRLSAIINEIDKVVARGLDVRE